MTSTTNITLHGMHRSGHVNRIQLLLSMLGLPFAFNVVSPEERASAAFRAMNPLGQIPVLQDGALTLADSNAILVYLCKRYAPGSSWLPEDPVGAAQVQRWLSIAAGEVAYGPANARATAQWQVPGDPVRAAAIAARLFGFMEQHLAARTFLAAEHATIADLACYGYVAHAPEGGIALDGFAALNAWLRRVEALPGFIGMPSLPVPQ